MLIAEDTAHWDYDEVQGRAWPSHADGAGLVLEALPHDPAFWSRHPDVAHVEAVADPAAQLVFYGQRRDDDRRGLQDVRVWLRRPLLDIETERPPPWPPRPPRSMRRPDLMMRGLGSAPLSFLGRHPDIAQIDLGEYHDDEIGFPGDQWEALIWLTDAAAHPSGG